jgi:putative transposase
MYHLVFPAKYRRAVFTEKVDEVLKWACLEMELRYEIYFLEIGTDKNHAHFLVQTVPMRSPTEIVTKIKSITAKKIFEQVPEVKQFLWGGEFWSSGYYVNTVSRYGSEKAVAEYVKNQGLQEYNTLHKRDPALDARDMGQMFII